MQRKIETTINVLNPDSNGDMGIELQEKWQPMTTTVTGEAAGDGENSKLVQFAVNASWLVNWFLLAAKIFCTITTSSKAVTAALADSAVDLVSQGVLAWAESYMLKHSPYYPVGRSRLEALSVIACAFIMSMASVEVVQYSIIDLYSGFNGRLPYLFVGYEMYLILGLGTFAKFFLWVYCARISKKYKSDMLGALAEDHFNDVMSNSAAIATASIAFNTTAWYLDPIGAILISVVIIGRWGGIMNEQIKKIVGYTAPPEYIQQVVDIALAHDTRLSVDCTRMYHFGARYNVEMEIVLPGDMTVRESHDIALGLQHKIEGLDDVERAFVHVDYLKRDGLEHKVERELVHSLQQAESPTNKGSNNNNNNNSSSSGNELRARYVTSGAVSDSAV